MLLQICLLPAWGWGLERHWNIIWWPRNGDSYNDCVSRLHTHANAYAAKSKHCHKKEMIRDLFATPPREQIQNRELLFKQKKIQNSQQIGRSNYAKHYIWWS